VPVPHVSNMSVLEHVVRLIGNVMELTSSPRSFPSLSCVLKVPSSAHLAQISSSALAKSSAGGRELMVELCFSPAYAYE